MRTTKKVVEGSMKRQTPAITPEGREDQMIAYDVNLAEEQVRNGTASSQVITHYLKLGSMRERMEKKKLQEEIKLLEAKTEAIKADREKNDLYAQVIEAIRTYTPHGAEDY